MGRLLIDCERALARDARAPAAASLQKLAERLPGDLQPALRAFAAVLFESAGDATAADGLRRQLTEGDAARGGFASLRAALRTPPALALEGLLRAVEALPAVPASRGHVALGGPPRSSAGSARTRAHPAGSGPEPRPGVPAAARERRDHEHLAGRRAAGAPAGAPGERRSGRGRPVRPPAGHASRARRAGRRRARGRPADPGARPRRGARGPGAPGRTERAPDRQPGHPPAGPAALGRSWIRRGPWPPRRCGPTPCCAATTRGPRGSPCSRRWSGSTARRPASGGCPGISGGMGVRRERPRPCSPAPPPGPGPRSSGSCPPCASARRSSTWPGGPTTWWPTCRRARCCRRPPDDPARLVRELLAREREPRDIAEVLQHAAGEGSRYRVLEAIGWFIQAGAHGEALTWLKSADSPGRQPADHRAAAGATGGADRRAGGPGRRARRADARPTPAPTRPASWSSDGPRRWRWRGAGARPPPLTGRC